MLRDPFLKEMTLEGVLKTIPENAQIQSLEPIQGYYGFAISKLVSVVVRRHINSSPELH